MKKTNRKMQLREEDKETLEFIANKTDKALRKIEAGDSTQLTMASLYHDLYETMVNQFKALGYDVREYEDLTRLCSKPNKGHYTKQKRLTFVDSDFLRKYGRA